MEQFSIFLYSAMKLHNFSFNILSKKITISRAYVHALWGGPVSVMGLGENGCD